MFGAGPTFSSRIISTLRCSARQSNAGLIFSKISLGRGGDRLPLLAEDSLASGGLARLFAQPILLMDLHFRIKSLSKVRISIRSSYLCAASPFVVVTIKFWLLLLLFIFSFFLCACLTANDFIVGKTSQHFLLSLKHLAIVSSRLSLTPHLPHCSFLLCFMRLWAPCAGPLVGITPIDEILQP